MDHNPTLFNKDVDKDVVYVVLFKCYFLGKSCVRFMALLSLKSRRPSGNSPQGIFWFVKCFSNILKLFQTMKLEKLASLELNISIVGKSWKFYHFRKKKKWKGRKPESKAPLMQKSFYLHTTCQSVDKENKGLWCQIIRLKIFYR